MRSKASSSLFEKLRNSSGLFNHDLFAILDAVVLVAVVIARLKRMNLSTSAQENVI